MPDLADHIRACTLCRERFAATHTAHAPRPVAWFASTAKLLIAGQAPGARVQASGVPFDDPSGERLRDWLGLTSEAFYDTARVAIVPMAFCFPGYNAAGADLPPPPICKKTWHADVLQSLPAVRLRLLVGGYAQKYHLGTKAGVNDTVKAWRAYANGTENCAFPLPHPSWRNTSWLKKNPWFEAELVPELRAAVSKVMK